MKLSILLISTLIGWQAFADDPPPPAPSLTTSVEITIAEAAVPILASSFGQTLYVFDNDIAPGKPSCNEKCAEIWPPITLSKAEVAALVGNADLAVQVRDSGLSQLTFKGRPVYQFNLDRVPGDIKGDGLGGAWHIIQL